MLAVPISIALYGSASHAIQKNDSAPLLSLRDHKGQFFHLSNHIGSKSSERLRGVVINFFSSSCGPCRKELPLLDAMTDELSAVGIKIVLIGYKEDFDRISRLLDALKVNKAVVLSDPYGKVGQKYGVYTLPLTVVVDADGVIKEVVRGEAPDIRAIVKRALSVK